MKTISGSMADVGIRGYYKRNASCWLSVVSSQLSDVSRGTTDDGRNRKDAKDAKDREGFRGLYAACTAREEE